MKTFYTTVIILLFTSGGIAQGGFSWAISDNYTGQHENYAFDLALDADNRRN
jgi:hypothetical protein